ncbi:FecR family protein [Spirosoma koreense]
MKPIVSQELLFDYFAGRVTSLQRQLIADWLRDPANEEIFYRYLDEWERQKLQYMVDATDALPRYRAFLHHEQPAAEPTVAPPNPPARSTFRNWLRVIQAASVVLLIGLIGWLCRDLIQYRTVTTTYGETRLLHLADGSKVMLNANSSLRVPRFGFSNRKREVLLTGEANFTVSHTPDDQRFVVHTIKGLDVVVLGTEFTVFTRPRQTKVVLAKGKVLVSYRASARQTGQLMLKPGDLVTLDNRGRLNRTTTAQPRDFAAWQQHRFVFDKTTLQEVGQLLTENYGIQVQINGEGLAQQTLTGSFHAKTADELLQAISEVMSINVVRHDDQVILSDNN